MKTRAILNIVNRNPHYEIEQEQKQRILGADLIINFYHFSKIRFYVVILTHYIFKFLVNNICRYPI